MKNKFVKGKGHIFNPTPTNDAEALKHASALASTGKYPVGTSGCFNVGISGGCGINCYLINSNRCDNPEECYEMIMSGKYDDQLDDFESDGNDDLNDCVMKRKKQLKDI